MSSLRSATIAAVLIAASGPAAAQQADPIRFFEGRTVDQGVMKVLFKKPYRTFAISEGRIEPDGSLTLIERVEDEGSAPHERRWHVRRTSPGHYVGAMSDALGPVTIDKIGDRYRFELETTDHLSVEQWLTPLPGGMAARSSTKVRKFGLTVATDDGMIRKMPVQ